MTKLNVSPAVVLCTLLIGGSLWLGTQREYQIKQFTEHTVQRGETPCSIITSYNKEEVCDPELVKSLSILNPHTKGSTWVGQRIIVPVFVPERGADTP